MGITTTVASALMAGTAVYGIYEGKKARDEATAERDRQARLQAEREAELKAQADAERVMANKQAWSRVNRRGYSGTILAGAGTGSQGNNNAPQLLGDIS